MFRCRFYKKEDSNSYKKDKPVANADISKALIRNNR